MYLINTVFAVVSALFLFFYTLLLEVELVLLTLVP